MEIIATLVVIFVLVGVWIAMAKRLKRKEVGFFLRHLAASTVATIATVVVAVVLAATGIVGKSDGDQVGQAAVVATHAPEPPHQPELEAAPIEQPSEATSLRSDLGMTAATFAARFNEATTLLDLPFSAPTQPVVKQGPVADSYRVMLNDYIAITAGVDKTNGMLYDLMLIGTGDGTTASGTNVILTTVAMFMAAANAVNEGGKKAAVDTFMKLTDKLDEKNDGGSVSTFFSGLKYSVSRPKDMGTWFTVTPAE